MGRTKTISAESIEVDYIITNDSFDYNGPSGPLTHKMPDSYEIERIAVYIEAIDEWLELTDNPKLLKVAENMVENHIQESRES